MENHIAFEDTIAQFTMIAIKGNMEGEPFDMGGYSFLAHPVKISDFWLCETLITQGVWETVMDANPSAFIGTNRPVEQVSYHDIVDFFLPKLNKNTEGVRPIGTEYQLPTEAQWEYAARGGKYWKKYNFDFSGSNKLNEVGWFEDNSHAEPKPVALKGSNLLGLYDMSGNILEWCKDWDSSDFYKVCQQQGIIVNPYNNQQGKFRILRGGNSFSIAKYCRFMYRDSGTQTYCAYTIGFRLALVYSSV
jgi:formylglycine-generating enzyme